jgi:hypothetical protein
LNIREAILYSQFKAIIYTSYIRETVIYLVSGQWDRNKYVSALSKFINLSNPDLLNSGPWRRSWEGVMLSLAVELVFPSKRLQVATFGFWSIPIGYLQISEEL